MKNKNTHNSLTVNSAIFMYEKLLKSGKIKYDGAAHKRLLMLYDYKWRKKEFRSDDGSI